MRIWGSLRLSIPLTRTDSGTVGLIVRGLVTGLLTNGHCVDWSGRRSDSGCSLGFLTCLASFSEFIMYFQKSHSTRRSVQAETV